MSTFLINITADLPYPIEKEFRVSGWDFGTAINRAVQLYRKDLKEQRGKARKIKSIRVKAIRV